jgi:hypothetical protein
MGNPFCIEQEAYVPGDQLTIWEQLTSMIYYVLADSRYEVGLEIHHGIEQDVHGLVICLHNYVNNAHGQLLAESAIFP